MKRIPEEEITRVKRDTDMIALVQSRGVKLTKQGINWTGLCPFHKDEKTPNLIVTPSKGLFRCMASCCGRAGNVIQFVEWFDGVSFRHAYDLLANGGSAVFENTKNAKKTTVPKMPCPLDPQADSQSLMRRVVKFYHERNLQEPYAIQYLQSRGFAEGERLLEMVNRFKIGYSDRSLGLRLPHKSRVDGKALRDGLLKIGIYRKSGHEHLNGSLTVPIENQQGEIVQMYGRRIARNKQNITHMYLQKNLAGVFNHEALKNREIILCESIIDAMTFWFHGMENVTCIFGTKNFTDEIFTAIKDKKIETVRIALDADKAGEEVLPAVSQRLQKIGVECYQVKFPWGNDANDYALNHGGEALKKAVRDAVWLGTCTPSSSVGAESVPKAKSGVSESISCAPSLIKKAANSLAAEALPPAVELNEKVAKKENVSGEVETIEPQDPKLSHVGDYYEFAVGERVYRVGGLHKNNSLEVLRITLRVTYVAGDREGVQASGLMHVDSLDLYRDGERRKFVDRASEETMLDKLLLKRDLGKLLLALEQVQEARLNGDDEGEEEEALSADEQAEALEFLKSPNLLEKISEAYDSAGLVGEATNKLAAYLACVSRKLAKPLAIIIQSTSAAGKSTLMDAVLSFFPKDELVKYSAMTGQSLYYLGESNLKHKILAIVEEEGAEKASYALKLLQSEGELTIASTGKDPHSGRMETQEYHVEGPVAIVFTTTSIDIDEELMNRCLVLTVDESREQTEKIHQLQREARTVEGILAKERRKDVQKLMQNMQRLIVPIEIANDFAPRLTFTSERSRTRRDHEKYLTLIDTIALLHQHQRETFMRKVGSGERSREIEMLPVTLEDIEAANKIAPEVLGRSLDELPPQTRRLLDFIKKLVKEKMAKTQGLDQNLTFFSRKELREFTGWTQIQIRRHLECLQDLEYIAQESGRKGVAMVYSLLTDINDKVNYAHVGLIDVEKLREKKMKVV